VSARLTSPRVTVMDAELLEHRARKLAAGAAAEDDATGIVRVVTFRLRGRACAVETAIVERAVVLSAPFAVPVADGSERAVAFVEERPVPIADLAGVVDRAPRRAARLAGSPAIVVETSGGPVAVAVEGPIELAEDRLSGAAEERAGEDDLRLAGILASGAVLLDAPWLAAWAERSARS